jgi:hypothetical protein
MVDFEQLDWDNHLQLMIGLDHKNIFIYKRMIKKLEVKEVEES